MSTIRPEPKKGILDIAAYVPGKARAPQGIRSVKLSSNETPLGASPRAVAAIEAIGRRLAEYPDAASSELRDAIAKVHQLNSDNIICGNGSDDLLSMLANAYLSAGDEAIYSEHGFLYYPIVIRAAGATAIAAKETDLTANVDAILSCVTPRTKIVFLANPNNPTGTYLPINEVRRLHRGLGDDVLLVIDAAYAEYVQRNDYEAGIELVSNSLNVVMTRTFSKIHGLAALRIGWAYAPAHIIDALNRIRGPFNVNAAAIAAGAAAIADSNHVQNSVEHNNYWISWVTQQIENLGLTVTPSVGNFVLIHFREGNHSASEADRRLTSKGYILRAVNGYGFPNALRMTIGGEEDNRAVVEILQDFMNEGND